jgi:hypothetical protein
MKKLVNYVGAIRCINPRSAALLAVTAGVAVSGEAFAQATAADLVDDINWTAQVAVIMGAMGAVVTAGVIVMFAKQAFMISAGMFARLVRKG